MKLRAVGYTRVSTEEQVKEGYSLSAQRRKIQSYCDVKDWELVTIYADEGISGTKLAKRPQALQMISDAQNGFFDVVIIMKIDRLCRNTQDLLNIVNTLIKHNVQLVAVDEAIDYSTPIGKTILTILGSIAELESNTIGHRIAVGKEQKALSGRYITSGARPFGYVYQDGKLVQEPSEAKAMREWYNIIIRGGSIRDIMIYNTANEIKTSRGAAVWWKTAIYRMLKNPIYKGYSNYAQGKQKMDIKCTDIVEPIFTPIEFESMCALVASHKIVAKADLDGSDLSYDFADVLYCGYCGRKLVKWKATGSYDTRRYVYYSCPRRRGTTVLSTNTKKEECQLGYINQKKIEEWLFKEIENQSLLDPDYNKPQELEKEISAIDVKIKKELSKKQRLLELHLDEKITQEEYTQAVGKILARITELNDEKASKNVVEDFVPLQTLEVLKDIAVNIREAWALFTSSERRLFVSTLFSRIEIFNNESLKIKYRQ